MKKDINRLKEREHDIKTKRIMDTKQNYNFVTFRDKHFISKLHREQQQLYLHIHTVNQHTHGLKQKVKANFIVTRDNGKQYLTDSSVTSQMLDEFAKGNYTYGCDYLTTAPSSPITINTVPGLKFLILGDIEFTVFWRQVFLPFTSKREYCLNPDMRMVNFELDPLVQDSTDWQKCTEKCTLTVHYDRTTECRLNDQLITLLDIDI